MRNFNLRHVALSVFMAVFAAFSLQAQSVHVKWSYARMDGSRTGVTAASANDVSKALGRVDGDTYYAPNGKVFKGGSVVSVASAVLGVQPVMANVKEVIGYSSKAMVRSYPECELSNLFIDVIMDRVSRETGKKVDVGIANFGGIRVDMPQGDILLDDIMSMFPFKNNIVYVSLKGSSLLKLFENMAKTKFQVLGGVNIECEDGELDKVLVGGNDIDPDKIYGVATISFLLNGGDDLFLGKNAIEQIDIPIDISEVMIDYVKAQTIAGRPVEYEKDGRVVIKKED